MRKNLIVGMILMVCFVLTGCGESGSDAGYQVYYLDVNGESLVAESFVPEAGEDDQNAMIAEMISALQTNGERDRLTNPIEPDIEFDEFRLKENQLSLYFTGAYNNKTGITEVLSRAAIVKTLCQVDGIDKIDFYVEDQPLMVDGDSIGQMDEDSFVENLGDQGQPLKRNVRLYFSDDTGQRLVSIDTEVTYPAAEKIAKLLVECLVAGPESVDDQDAGDLLRTVPTGTVINNVTIRDNICYLDLSREFLELLPNVTSDVTVFSIVDTLCELPSISRVQFTINSGVRDRYGETSDFNRSFERNLDLVEG